MVKTSFSGNRKFVAKQKVQLELQKAAKKWWPKNLHPYSYHTIRVFHGIEFHPYNTTPSRVKSYAVAHNGKYLGIADRGNEKLYGFILPGDTLQTSWAKLEVLACAIKDRL